MSARWTDFHTMSPEQQDAMIKRFFAQERQRGMFPLMDLLQTPELVVHLKIGEPVTATATAETSTGLKWEQRWVPREMPASERMITAEYTVLPLEREGVGE